MPEHGWMYNKGVCCYYDKMPKIFAEASSLGVQLDLDRWQKETTMFLVITTIHPTIDVGHTMNVCVKLPSHLCGMERVMYILIPWWW